MVHQGTVELHSERLLLRRLTQEDAQAMYENWACDPEVTRFLTWSHYTDPAQAQATLRLWEEQYSSSSFYQWGIVPTQLGQPIGTISVVDYSEKIGLAEIGYCIGQRWWHQGYASEALMAVMAFLFEKVQINRLGARHDCENPRSGHVMKKCGLHFEGVLRSAGWNNQGIVDIAVYSMLAQEYQALKAQAAL